MLVTSLSVRSLRPYLSTGKASINRTRSWPCACACMHLDKVDSTSSAKRKYVAHTWYVQQYTMSTLGAILIVHDKSIIVQTLPRLVNTYFDYTYTLVSSKNAKSSIRRDHVTRIVICVIYATNFFCFFHLTGGRYIFACYAAPTSRVVPVVYEANAETIRKKPTLCTVLSSHAAVIDVVRCMLCAQLNWLGLTAAEWRVTNGGLGKQTLLLLSPHVGCDSGIGAKGVGQGRIFTNSSGVSAESLKLQKFW